jgi:hypothetical protein
MVLREAKNKNIGKDGKKRSIQRSTPQKRVSKWSQEEETVYKEVSGSSNPRSLNSWAP